MLSRSAVAPSTKLLHSGLAIFTLRFVPQDKLSHTCLHCTLHTVPLWCDVTCYILCCQLCFNAAYDTRQTLSLPRSTSLLRRELVFEKLVSFENLEHLLVFLWTSWSIPVTVGPRESHPFSRHAAFCFNYKKRMSFVLAEPLSIRNNSSGYRDNWWVYSSVCPALPWPKSADGFIRFLLFWDELNCLPSYCTAQQRGATRVFTKVTNRHRQ